MVSISGLARLSLTAARTGGPSWHQGARDRAAGQSSQKEEKKILILPPAQLTNKSHSFVLSGDAEFLAYRFLSAEKTLNSVF